MITCPWCGTHYERFQSNCDNCGGSLPLPAERPPTPAGKRLPTPPPPPRQVPGNYAWRVLSTDGGAIGATVFSLLGAIFAIVGGILTISVVAIFVGLPFAALGTVFLLIGIPLLITRYEQAQQTVQVLQHGEAVLGQIVDVHQNYHVRINGRSPWIVTYQFEASGRQYQGKVSTLSRPDLGQQPGQPIYVLYQPNDPQQNTSYPYPYGYYDL
ncbi:MAG: DUF3592 domain-containing protein [Anaerolineae bacterium]|nr:DUF3592 domain-containing protein [Anaerolineae bacterium]